MTASLPSGSFPSDPEAVSWQQVVERKVAGLRFGSVQIVVHEGRVTQIESTEKFRFQPRPSGETAASAPGAAGRAD